MLLMAYTKYVFQEEIRAKLKFVPGAGLEPARPQRPQDFKSCVSTNSTIRAEIQKNKELSNKSIYFYAGLACVPACRQAGLPRRATTGGSVSFGVYQFHHPGID